MQKNMGRSLCFVEHQKKTDARLMEARIILLFASFLYIRREKSIIVAFSKGNPPRMLCMIMIL